MLASIHGSCWIDPRRLGSKRNWTSVITKYALSDDVLRRNWFQIRSIPFALISKRTVDKMSVRLFLLLLDLVNKVLGYLCFVLQLLQDHISLLEFVHLREGFNAPHESLILTICSWFRVHRLLKDGDQRIFAGNRSRWSFHPSFVVCRSMNFDIWSLNFFFHRHYFKIESTTASRIIALASYISTEIRSCSRDLSQLVKEGESFFLLFSWWLRLILLLRLFFSRRSLWRHFHNFLLVCNFHRVFCHIDRNWLAYASLVADRR